MYDALAVIAVDFGLIALLAIPVGLICKLCPRLLERLIPLRLDESEEPGGGEEEEKT